MSFLNSLSNNSTKYEDPFDHWELNRPLTDEQIIEIINAIQTIAFETSVSFSSDGPIVNGNKIIIATIKTIMFIKSLIDREYVLKSFIMSTVKIFL